MPRISLLLLSLFVLFVFLFGFELVGKKTVASGRESALNSFVNNT